MTGPPCKQVTPGSDDEESDAEDEGFVTWTERGDAVQSRADGEAAEAAAAARRAEAAGSDEEDSDEDLVWGSEDWTVDSGSDDDGVGSVSDLLDMRTRAGDLGDTHISSRALLKDWAAKKPVNTDSTCVLEQAGAVATASNSQQRFEVCSLPLSQPGMTGGGATTRQQSCARCCILLFSRRRVRC